MMRYVLWGACLCNGLLAGCASVPTGPSTESHAANQKAYVAPWASSEALTFKYLLGSFGKTHLATNREETLDRLLRSRTVTFDRYVAAQEVGVGVPELKQEAVAEIDAISGELQGKSFFVATSLPFGQYDAGLGGFPIFDKRWDKASGIRYFNEDVRTGSQVLRKSYGTESVNVISEGYGFTEATVWFSKVGWVIPASAEQAVTLIEELSKSGQARKVAVALVFSVDRCDPDNSSEQKMVCAATAQNMYGYGRIENIRAGVTPTVELVQRGDIGGS